MKMRIFLLAGGLLILALLLQPLQYSFASNNNASGELVFDFAANAAYAQWRSGAGNLPFPGTSGDHRGFAQRIGSPVLEDGTRGMVHGLLVVPQNKFDGYLQGIYPEFTVQKNDRFQALVGCEFTALGCSVTFRLDYVTSAGATKVFWQWKESYDKRTYSVDLDLSTLAGSKVRFVLTMLANGSPSGDRPLWVAPRLVRPGNGQTPLPPLTPTATPFVTPPPITASSCDRAAFVSDVTVRDGTLFSPGAPFTKTWRIKNSGNCPWTKDYALVFYSGELMNAPTVVNLPWSVAPGALVDVTVNAVAPVTPGTYRGNWILRNASGSLFGIGISADKPFWMLISVAGAAPASDSGYDFVSNICAAQWKSGAGALPCPHTDGDSRGFALVQPQTMLEDKSISTSALLTQPQSKYNGYIQGTYPTFTIQPGDRFQAVVGCEQNANCYVTFRLEYLTAGGEPRIFWQWKERNEGKTYRVDLDLSSLAGQSLRFVLTTLASGTATGDRAVWVDPRIVRLGFQIATPTPTFTPTLVSNSGTIVPNPLIRALYMLDASNGWATADNYTLRTTNGGLTWYNVLPEVVPTGAYFQNALNGWVVSDYADLSVGSLYRTTNGGSNWTHYDVPFSGGIVQFLDNNNGFVLSGSPIGMQKHPIALYQTADGGATWTLKYANTPEGTNQTLPVGGHKGGMAFRDSLNGWIGGDYAIDGYFYFYRTIDGGLTWSRVQLTLPVGYESAFITTGAPKFFGVNDAILPVWMTIGADMRDLFLYSSHDGGNTWVPSASFARNAEITDILSISSAIGWNWANLFHLTVNSGSSWMTITPNLNFGNDFRGLDFVSPSTGWLIQAPVNGSTPLYHTIDGGATWTILSGGYTPSPDPAVFAQSLVDELNVRNLGTVRATMDQTFAFAFWESQGYASTPEQALETLRTNYLGPSPLVSDSGKDLTVLLGGLNPYTIMGLDPARSKALFVSGWGADGKTEAILYVNRRTDGSLYFYGLLIAPFGFIHPTATPSPTPTETLTPTPTATPTLPPPTPGFTGPYAVFGIPAPITLMVYSAAGANNPLVGEFSADTKTVERGMYTVPVEGSQWVYVYTPDKRIGWVDDQYLIEYITPEQFAADSRPVALIDKLKQAMTNADGDLFASLVSPKHGVKLLYHGTVGSNPVTYLPDQARNAFASTEVINWGPEGASGTNAVGTFSEIVRPKLLDTLNATYELHANDPITHIAPEPWPSSYQNLNYFGVLKPGTPDVVFDWRLWLVGFEYVDGVPYIVTMLHYVWEP